MNIRRLQELAGISSEESIQEKEGGFHSNIQTTWTSEGKITTDIYRFLMEISSRNGNDAAMDMSEVIQGACQAWESGRDEDDDVYLSMYGDEN